MRARPFSDSSDLRRMQQLVQDAWSLAGLANAWHVGGVAWEAASGAGREREWARRLWEEGGRVVAWAWLDRPATLGWQLDPRRPELLDDVLAWVEEEVEGDSIETSVLASDASALDILQRRGYAVVADAPWFAYTVRDLEDIPEHELPRLRPAHRHRRGHRRAGRHPSRGVGIRPASRASAISRRARRGPTATTSTALPRRRTARLPPTRSAGTTKRIASASSSRSGRGRASGGAGSAVR